MYLGAELLNAVEYLRHVASLEQVDGLERACFRYAVRFTEFHEVCDVFHLKRTIIHVRSYMYVRDFG